jgi:YHS domain-containing protein
MVAWMRIRGHGWRHGFEMAAGMLVPWAAVLVLVGLGAATVLPWLADAADAAMLLGMLGVMLLRPHHYAHGAHHHHAASADQSTTDPVCGMPLALRTASRTAEYQGQTYYFCAPGCRKTFLADPRKVLATDYTSAM